MGACTTPRWASAATSAARRSSVGSPTARAARSGPRRRSASARPSAAAATPPPASSAAPVCSSDTEKVRSFSQSNRGSDGTIHRYFSLIPRWLTSDLVPLERLDSRPLYLKVMMIISPFGQLGLWAPSSGVRDVFTSITHVFKYLCL